MPNTTCSVCASPRRSEINELLAVGTPLRQLERSHAIGRGPLGRHALQCLGVAGTDKRRHNAQRRTHRRLALVGSDIKPVEGAADVIADLQRLRVEAFTLFEAAKSRADWAQAQKLFAQLMSLVDRFGELHGILRQKGAGVTVNIDASQKALVTLGSWSEETVLEMLGRAERGEPIVLPTLDSVS